MESIWTVGGLGVVLPVVLYMISMLNFLRLKMKAEMLTGRTIPVSWRKHQSTIWVGWLKYVAVIFGLFLLNWDFFSKDGHEAMMFLSIITSLVMLMVGIPATSKGFVVGDFVSKKEICSWYEDVRQNRYFFWNEGDHYLERDIKHLDYLPVLLDARPLIREKNELKNLIANISHLTTNASELERLVSGEERFWVIQDKLNANFDLLDIAVGQKTRPEIEREKKDKSLKRLEQLLNEPSTAVSPQLDPALTELYTLAQNEEAPEDIKELVKRTIAQIEEKLETKNRNEKENAIRRSAEAVIQASRQYHGV